MTNTVERGLINKSSLTAIGDAIRAKNGSATKYKPSEMAAAISELKTGEFAVATSDKFTYKVIQSANQVITSTPAGKAVNNSNGTISLALTDTTTISPNTNYIPGTIKRSYDDSTHTYTVTATDAEPIDGLVQDGWSVVYQKNPGDDAFYTNSDYTGNPITSTELQGNILIGGMSSTFSSDNWMAPMGTDGMLKFKNTFVTSVGSHFLHGCSSLTSVELPNLTNADYDFLYNCPSLTNVELPNLTNMGQDSLNDCNKLHSAEFPKLANSYTLKIENLMTTYFIDFGYITDISQTTFMHTRVMVLRADTFPKNFIQSMLSDSVLYIVPSALVDTYKSKVRSQDYVTALEKSPFADGKTVCGNNMKTEYSESAKPEGIMSSGTHTFLTYDCYGGWEYQTYSSAAGATPDKGEFFHFLSKLTEEKGYTILTSGGE